MSERQKEGEIQNVNDENIDPEARADRSKVEQQYVVYLNDNGELVGTHGGPYPPTKAREVRKGMQSDIDRGNYSDWSIPQEAERAESVGAEKYQQMKREMLGVEDAE